ncbi:MAG: ABC transporter permease subunit [Proteobacteria bacterium]|nr:ABC transporter permease subunit [Pseudomonadota bacterium]
MKLATKIRLAAIVAFLVAVELLCRTALISRFTLIPPSEMATGLARILWAGKTNGEIATTLSGIAMAAACSIAVGFLLGAVLHSWPRARASLDPLLATYYSIPIFVFYPLFIVFFGMNRTPIVVIGFLFAVVAMMTNTLNGLDRVPRVLLKTARVLRLRRARTTLLIVLPSAAPHIFGGAKLAIAYSFVGVLGAEFILSSTGVGYQIAFAFNNFDNVQMYSLILFVVIVVATVNSALFAWERALLQRRGQW